MVHSDSDLILHNSSVLIDKEPKTIHLAGPPTKSATKRRLKDLFFYFSSKLFSTSIPQESFLK
ncbi:hypothetical protein EGK22_08210 [Enterococcus faecium]|nr:hypothetical protein EGK22_08210 [Enterococcus faecium]RSA58887.1 hypothetical protein EGK28_08210 [Enterococcus faecium]